MVTLGVRDLARSVRFYEQGLGLPRMPFDSDEVAFFPLAGAWLSLYGREDLAEDAGIAAAGSGFGGFSLAHNVSSREEVDTTLTQAAASRCKHRQAGAGHFLGRLCRLFRRSRRSPLGGGLEPAHAHRTRLTYPARAHTQ